MLLCVATVSACGSPAATAPAQRTPTGAGEPSPCGRTSTAARTYAHVVWIWMENHQGTEVLGPTSPAPYERRLAAQCGSATHYASVGSPSLPNYIGATSGATQQITDDADPSRHPLRVDNLFGQVRAAGGTARSYEESMARPCQLSSSGRYAVKHNPAAYYVGGADRAACRHDDVGFRNPAQVVRGHLPTFTFITPDLCHDTHNCSVATGDAFLARMVPALVATPDYRSGTTAIFVAWDEPTPMPFLAIAPSVPAATVVGQPLDHYSLLATTEELLGLPTRLGAAARSTSMRTPFHL